MFNFRFQILLYLIIFTGFRLYANEEEFKRKKEEFERCVEKICSLLSDSRSELRYVYEQYEQMLRITNWVKDYYPAERDWAEKHQDDIKKLEDTLDDYFEELLKVFDAFPKQTEELQYKVERKLEEILRALENEQNNLQQDLSKLYSSEEKLKQLSEEMKILGNEVYQYIQYNQKIREFDDWASRVKNYYGSTSAASKFREALSRGIYERQRILNDLLNRFKDKCGEVSRGQDYDKFKNLHYKLSEAIKLFKNNAQEVIEWTKKLEEQKREIHSDLKDIADLIKDGRVQEATRKNIELFKEISQIYRDIERSVVFQALPYKWLENYSKQSKSLNQHLEALEKVRNYFEEVRQKLNEMINRVDDDLEDYYESPIRDSDLTALGKAGERLSKDYWRYDAEITEKIKSGMQQEYYIRFDSQEDAFDNCESALQSVFDRWTRETKSFYDETYKKNDIRYAFWGNKAPEGPFAVAVDKILQSHKQNVFKILQEIGARVESGSELKNDHFREVYALLEKVASSCNDANVRQPHWVPSVAKDIQKLLSSGIAEFQKFYEMHRQYPVKIEALRNFSRGEADRLERLSREMTEAEHLKELFRSVQQSSSQTRDKFKEANDVVRDYANVLDKLQDLKNSDDLSYPFFNSLKKRVEVIQKEILEVRKQQLEDERVMGLLRGLSEDSQSQYDRKMGHTLMEGVLKLLTDIEKFHRMRIGNLAERLDKEEKILSEIESFQKDFDKDVQLIHECKTDRMGEVFGVALKDAFNKLKEFYKHFECLVMILKVNEEWDQLKKEMEEEIVKLNEQNLKYVQEINALQEINEDMYKSWQEKYKELQKKSKIVAWPPDNQKLMQLLNHISKVESYLSNIQNPDIQKTLNNLGTKHRDALKMWQERLNLMLNWEQGSTGELLRRLYEKSSDAQKKFEEEVKKFLEDLKKVTKVTGNKKEVEKNQKEAAKLLEESIERKFEEDDGHGSVALLQIAYAGLRENYSLYFILYLTNGEKAYRPALQEWLALQQKSVELLKICYDRYERQHLEFYKKPAADIVEAVYKSEESLRKYGEFLEKTFESIENWCKNEKKYSYEELGSKIDFLKEWVSLDLDNSIRTAIGGDIQGISNEYEVADFMREIASMSEMNEAQSMKSRAKEHWNINFSHVDDYVEWKQTAASFPAAPVNYIERLKMELAHLDRVSWKQLVASGSIYAAEKELEQYSLSHPIGDCQTFADLLNFLTLTRYQDHFLKQWGSDFGSTNEEMLDLVKSLPHHVDFLASIRERMIEVLNESYDRWSEGVYREAKDRLAHIQSYIQSVRGGRP